MDRRQARVNICGVLGAIVLAAIGAINGFMQAPPQGWAVAYIWGGTVLLMIVFLALVGVALRGRPATALIDATNTVSLARLQAAGWTVLVLSALITLTAVRIRTGNPNPVGFTIPGELLAAMGISLTSLVASPALRLIKASRTADDPVSTSRVVRAAEESGRSPQSAVRFGTVLGWSSIDDAQWMDMFRGETTENGPTADLSKIQQFLITLVLLAVYGWALWAFFWGVGGRPPPNLDALPPLSQQFVWLLAISHGGYLVAKALPAAPPAKPAVPDAQAPASPPPPPAT